MAQQQAEATVPPVSGTSGLPWVREELDNSVDRVRLALEEYSEEPDDALLLQRGVVDLHQIAGTASVVQCHGAALLAETMQAALQALLPKSPSIDETALSVILGACVQLTDYIDLVSTGESDCALVLLPLINELRVSHREPALTEKQLFHEQLIRLALQPQVDAAASRDASEAKVMAAKMLPVFQTVLLGWMQGKDAEANLKRIGAVAERVHATSTNPLLAELWSLLAALVESLLLQKPEKLEAVKRLFGHYLKVLKAQSVGQENLADQSLLTLIHETVFVIGRLAATGARTQTVRERYQLNQYLPDTEELLEVRRRLRGPNTAVLDQLAGAIRQDIEQVKDQIDLVERAGEAANVDMDSTVDILTRMADTLGMLGLVAQQRETQGQVKLLENSADGMDSRSWMELATSLLRVESSLDESLFRHVHQSESYHPASELAGATAKERDFLHGAAALLREGLINVGRVKEDIGHYLRAGSGVDLASVAGHMAEIASALQIIQQNTAANCANIIQELCAPEALQSLRGQETYAALFADAVAALEYFLEALKDELPRSEALANAAYSKAEKAKAHYLQIQAEKPDEATEGEATPAVPVVEEEAAVEQTVDIEFREIFIEEAQELLQQLTGCLQAWESEDEEFDDLTSIRGIFHTLKGSGRMVQAMQVGDLSWALESLLNQCLEGAAVASAATRQLVSDAAALLPTLLDEYARTPHSTSGREAVQEIVQRAAVMQESEYAGEADRGSASADVADIDPEMYDIFRQEAQEHREALVEFSEQQEGIVAVPQTAIRALHTLRGGTGTVGYRSLSLVCGRLEDLGISLNAAKQGVPKEYLAATEALNAVLTEIFASEKPIAVDVSDIDSDLDCLTEALPEAAADAAASLELARIFTEEAFDLVNEVEDQLSKPDYAESIEKTVQNILPALHTLKGSALTSGATALGRLAGVIEAAISTADADYLGRVLRVTEDMYSMLDAFRDGALEDEADRGLERFLAGEAAHPLDDDSGDQPPLSIDQPIDQPSEAGEESTTRAELSAETLSNADGEPADSTSSVEAESEEIDPEILEIFLAEGEELVDALDAAAQLEDSAESETEIKRILHTLKGSARMSGLSSIGDLAHDYESALDKVANEQKPALINGGNAQLHRHLDVLLRGESALPPEAFFNAQNDSIIESPVLDAADDEADEASDEAFATTAQPAEEDSDETVKESSAEALPIDPEIFEIFLAEGEEILDGLDALEVDFDTEEDSEAELKRLLHTLKGSARMAGLSVIGDIAHDYETELDAAAEADHPAIVHARNVQLHRHLDTLLRGEPPLPADDAVSDQESQPTESQPDQENIATAGRSIETVSSAASVQATEMGDAEPVVKQEPPETVSDEIPADSPEEDNDAISLNDEPERRRVTKSSVGQWHEQLLAAVQKPDSTVTSPSRKELARVPVEHLDNLLNQAGEISIFRSRLEQQNAGLNFQLLELEQTVTRIRNQVRALENEADAQILARQQGGLASRPDRYGEDFDPLEMDRYSRMQELTRALAEGVTDLGSLHSTMFDLSSESDTLLLQQGRVNTAVQQGLMDSLMVPFERQTARLERIVQQTAATEKKQAGIVFEGADSELDRNVLERMTAPLEHLLRNSVVHGIETPEVRRQAGKQAAGTIVVKLWRDGGQLAIEVRDDGGGLDAARIRETAITRGLMPEDAEISDEDVIQYIFEPGFSTAESVTQTAGRGVGMDVVNAEVKQLGGTLEVGSEPGKGAVFLIRLPLTLALSQALLVQVGEENYAVPVTSVDAVARIAIADIPEHLEADGKDFEYGGTSYKTLYFGDLVGLPRPDLDTERKYLPVILTHMGEGLGGERRVAIVVDSTIGSREVVSKAVGLQVSSVLGISGATILPDGAVVLIVDLVALIQHHLRRSLKDLVSDETTAVMDQRQLVMVVDDSITMRRVAERLLLRNGYRVLAAKDGMEAINLLEAEHPATILLDIEMPKVDGFEVATYIRNSERLADMPIVMITSRSGDKHRERARQIGVDRYLIKPYQEDQLMAEIHAVLQPTAGQAESPAEQPVATS